MLSAERIGLPALSNILLLQKWMEEVNPLFDCILIKMGRGYSYEEIKLLCILSVIINHTKIKEGH